MAGEGPYMNQDDQYAALISNLISPPDDEVAQAASKPDPQQTAPDPRMAVPDGEPPNPTLKTRPQPVQQPAQPAPAVPATVTPNGASGGAPPTTQKDWPAYYARESMKGALGAAGKQQSAVDPILNQPTAEEANADLIKKRAAYAIPLNPQDPNYRPTGWQRFGRGVRSALVGAATGGIPGAVVGAIQPQDVRGGVAYSAPNRQYQIDTAQHQGNAAAIDEQLKQMDEARKSDTDRMGKIGTQEKDIAAAYSGVAKNASEQQTAENQSKETAIKQQQADQAAIPKDYAPAVIAAALEKDPQRKAALTAAAKTIAATEVKKFQYAARAQGDPFDERRQTMIDAATADVQKLNDYQWDQDLNDGHGGFYDPASPNKVYTPEEFTDAKNKISTKLDKDLAAKKLRPLGVRFNVKATTPQGGQATAAPAAQPAAAPTPQGAPKSAAETQPGQIYKNHQLLGGDWRDAKNWKWVGQGPDPYAAKRQGNGSKEAP